MRTPKMWLAVAGLLLVAGCSVQGGPESTAEDSAGDAPAAADDLGAPSDERDSDGGTGLGIGTVADDRQVITSGSVTMSVEDPRAIAQELSVFVESLGGWVEEREERAGTEDEDASAHLVVRIPSRDVTPTLERLETLGTVQDVSLARSDVTMQVRDMEARTRALELSIDRMEALLARAATTSELVQAEQMLTERQSELDSLLSQRASLAEQVSMSTLRIQLWTPAAIPEPEPEPPTGFWGGLVTGWNAFVASLEVALLVIGVLLPWAAFTALVILAVIAIRRWNKQRRAAKGLPAAPTNPMAPFPPTAPAPVPAAALPQYGGPQQAMVPEAGPPAWQQPGAEQPAPPSTPPAKPQVERRTPRPRVSGPARRPPDPGPQG